MGSADRWKHPTNSSVAAKRARTHRAQRHAPCRGPPLVFTATMAYFFYLSKWLPYTWLGRLD